MIKCEKSMAMFFVYISLIYCFLHSNFTIQVETGCISIGCIMTKIIIQWIFYVHVVCFSLSAQGNYNIVFIHIGPSIPDYTSVALSQAGLFNPKCPIILVANQKALDNFHPVFRDMHYIPVACETLVKTQEHHEFVQKTTLNSTFREGFWKYASERFLVLHDLMQHYSLENVFHMEYDNLLYANLEELLPLFKNHYPGIAATFDNDERCIPGFIFFRHPSAMQKLAKYFAKLAEKGVNDMRIIARFKNETNSESIGHLPIIMEKYVKKMPLSSTSGHTVENPYLFCNNSEPFNSIFDAAALGQFLGGIDPRNRPSIPGFINESCVFNASYLKYAWEFDSKGRKIPYALWDKKRYRINNLHIHSKRLKDFAS